MSEDARIVCVSALPTAVVEAASLSLASFHGEGDVLEDEVVLTSIQGWYSFQFTSLGWSIGSTWTRSVAMLWGLGRAMGNERKKTERSGEVDRTDSHHIGLPTVVAMAVETPSEWLV